MTQDQYGQARGPGYVVRGDVVPETEEFPAESSKPTRFQKVASALRGGTEREDRVQAGQTGQDRPSPAADPAATEASGASGASGAPGSFGTSPPWVTEQDEAAMAGAEQDEPVAVTRPDTMGHPATEPDLLSSTARPGEPAGALGDFSDLTYGNLIPDAERYTSQWQQIQFRFVDDPQGSVTAAADIVAQVTAKMEAAIQERQRAIQERQQAIAEQQRSLRGRWGNGANADTEALRETLRMYKTFLDQLVGSRAG